MIRGRRDEPMLKRGADAGRIEAAVAAATRSRGRDLRLYVRVHDDCIRGGVKRVFMTLTTGLQTSRRIAFSALEAGFMS